MTRPAGQIDEPPLPLPERVRTGETTTNLFGMLPFPEPHVVLALRASEVFRSLDEDDEPVLIISDGVTAVAVECGLQGLTFGAVRQMRLVADALDDYVKVIERAYAATQDD